MVYTVNCFVVVYGFLLDLFADAWLIAFVDCINVDELFIMFVVISVAVDDL